MAAIGKIREKSGLLIAIIGIALAGFVLNDLFGSLGRGGSMGGDRFTTANINDEQVKTEYFQRRLDKAIQNMEDQGQQVTSEMRYDIMDRTWAEVQKEFIFRQQCEAIGMAQENGNDIFPSISNKEYVDIIKGDNLHPAIMQSFPQPGQFEQTLTGIEAQKQSQNQADIEEAFRYDRMINNLLDYVKADQLKTKYNQLIEKSYYLPSPLAEEMNKLNTSSFSVKYYAIKYNSQDMNAESEAIVPTEADYEAYYNEHINEFEVAEDRRKIDYVVWNVTPSEEDMAAIRERVEKLYVAFKDQPADKLKYFVNQNRGRGRMFDSLWRKPADLSQQIDSNVLEVEDDFVFSPIMEDNAYKIIRVMQHDSRPDSMRASHILIAYAGSLPGNDSITRIKLEADALADSILDIVNRQPERFDEFATGMSDDTESAKKAGDLDWFVDGAMVPQFNEACVRGQVGDIVKVETNYGYHILKVTGRTEPQQKVRVAQVQVDIEFSNETKERIYMEANRFAAENKDSASFYTALEENGLSVLNDELTKMSKEIKGIKDSRNIVKWAFGIGGVEAEERELFQVSDVFDYPTQIVVAIVTEVQDKGTPSLEDVKSTIHKLVQRDVEAKKIMDEVGSNPDFYAVAKDRGINIDSMEYLNFAYRSLKGYGPEPFVLGSMQGAEKGVTYGPIKGNQGVFFFIVNEHQEPMEVIDNYENIRGQELRAYSQRLQENFGGDNDVYKALKEQADIEDFRYNFW